MTLLVAMMVHALLATPPAWGQALVEGMQTDLEVQFAEAEAVFFSADQLESIALLDVLIERLDGLLAAGQPESVSLLLRSLAYRAQAHHNLGDEATARADLGRMLSVDPSCDVDRDVVSPKFTELFDAVRAVAIGHLSVLIAPPDALLWIDGEVIDWSVGLVALGAGSHAVSVERMGFKTLGVDVDIVPGQSESLETILERTSAVAMFTLSPADSAVQLDGNAATLIVGRPGSVRTPDARGRSLAGLTIGEHRIQVSRDGYRTRTHVFEVDELADLDLGALALERAVGVLVLSDLPADASVAIDGAGVAIQRTADGAARIELSPATYTVEINAGRRGVFAATVGIVDREEALVDVRPRPSVAFLGVLGDDDLGRDTLVEAAERALDGHPLWMWQDRSERADTVLANAGLDSSTLRAGTTLARERVAAARAGIAQTVGASAYVLVVLDDDLVATGVDLWIWPSPPGPAAIEKMSFPLDEGTLSDDLRSAFSIDLGKRSPYLGAQWVDSAASPFPIVVAVAADGPAAAAGIVVGDGASAIDGTAVTNVAELRRAIARGGARDVEIQVRRGGAEITMRAPATESIEVLLPGADGVSYGLVWAAAEAHEFLVQDPAPDWVLGLARAAVLLHTRQWEEAVRLLRTVRAPARTGVGQGMVDYWLGLALLQLGPNYRDHAHRSFEMAAAVDGATLGHDDGPLIGPLARALLTALGEGS